MLKIFHNSDGITTPINAQEKKFIGKLQNWLRNPHCHKQDGVSWVYHTYEQWSEELSISKSTVIRTVRSLEKKGIIARAYLSKNKRNRTTYYSINKEILKEYAMQKEKKKAASKKPHHVIKKAENPAHTIIPNDNMYIYKYNIYYNNKSINHIESNNINIKAIIPMNTVPMSTAQMSITPYVSHATAHKAIKSTKRPTKADKLSVTNTEAINAQSETLIAKEKPTIVQDMIKIWCEEFPSIAIRLTKQLARFLVAAFKAKFGSCLKTWRRYLRLLKTSEFITKPGFRLDIWWVIKYLTIDRINDGWLGVNADKIPADKSEEEAKVTAHFEAKEREETPEALEIRHMLEQKLGTKPYLNWFDKVRIDTQGDTLYFHVENAFIRDYIKTLLEKSLGREYFKRSQVVVRKSSTVEKIAAACSRIINSSNVCSKQEAKV